MRPCSMPMEGGLHGHCLGAGVAHGGQQAMHRQHVGRGQAAAQCLTVGQHRPSVPMVPQALSLRLSACAIHWTEEVLPLVPVTATTASRRTAVPGIAQPAQQSAQARDLQQGDLTSLGQHGIVHGRFAQHRAGALRHGPFYIETSVAGQAGAGDKHVTRLDLARVQLEMRGQRHALITTPRSVQPWRLGNLTGSLWRSSAWLLQTSNNRGFEGRVAPP